MSNIKSAVSQLAIVAGLALSVNAAASADQVFVDDVIVQGSLCVGFDCVNGESFGFDTLRLKENNLRIHFNDTSTTASFPSNDWRLVANDTGNGGDNYFAIEDSTAGRIPFRVEAGAPASSLYVDSSGDVGIGTSTPVVDAHVRSGNTPTLRLEQDGSNGFASQTWDVAGNEANFFVRDVTNGSRLSFRIRPGAPESSIDVQGSGNVGIGYSGASTQLHVRESDSGTFYAATFDGPGAKAIVVNSTTNGGVQYRLQSNSGNRRIVGMDAALAVESQIVLGDNEVQILGSSNADVYGTFTASGLVTAGPTCNPGPCDGTFDPDVFTVPSIEDHAAYMWENQHLWAVGPTRPGEPFNVTQKSAGMLHELEVAHIYIEQLNNRLNELESQVAAQD